MGRLTTQITRQLVTVLLISATWLGLGGCVSRTTHERHMRLMLLQGKESLDRDESIENRLQALEQFVAEAREREMRSNRYQPFNGGEMLLPFDPEKFKSYITTENWNKP